ncbi:hypothetical protein AGMMS49983_09340 [Clostridia bacterium]|nr:hypothetical protein AGMMS49983_09340 [Clostridia bacterium]
MLNNNESMNYISDTLGIKVGNAFWEDAAKLPYFLHGKYDFQRIVLEDVPCIFITPKGSLDPLTAIKKHLQIINEVGHLPIALFLEDITPARKRSLIGAHIPFVAGKDQIYLPFMGIVLRERQCTRKPPSEKLMPATQALFIYCLYLQQPKIYINGLDGELNYSAMQISRAAGQLGALGIASVYKQGVQVVLAGFEDSSAAIDRAKPFLINPANHKKLYVEKQIIERLKILGHTFLYAGMSALSRLTMMNPPVVETVAYYGKVHDLIGTPDLIDSDIQYEVEMWKYDPDRLLRSTYSDVVDPLSLAASFMDSMDDPRIEQAIENLFENEGWIWR